MDTVAALASHIIRSFDLQETCPRGLLLSMDQFVLPPFESTEIFKDKDVIGVRKRGATLTEAIMFSQDANHIKDSKIIDKQALLLCDDVVAGEEFVKESGGYESEDEENVGDQATEMVCHETPLNGKTGSKRKRDSSRPSSSKKRRKPDLMNAQLFLKAPGNAILEEVHPEEDDVGLGISSRRNRSYDERSSSKRQDATLKDAAYTTEDKQIEGQESHQIKAAEVNASVSDKKTVGVAKDNDAIYVQLHDIGKLLNEL
ncbi:unnamed protein product [Spirodela intermedia]|uniref:Coilin N-terminal domain-containing protein n=1 Tax=Spirodela intermedia TaxID=51605 RepID=A0A7I8INT9_SPIIN|nr:unnamed protein product [Spirodela intermedia]CAA6659566.1 unnamed protein product [Spirodela intermedia]